MLQVYSYTVTKNFGNIWIKMVTAVNDHSFIHPFILQTFLVFLLLGVRNFDPECTPMYKAFMIFGILWRWG